MGPKLSGDRFSRHSFTAAAVAVTLWSRRPASISQLVQTKQTR